MFHVEDGKTFKKINSTHFEYIFGYYRTEPLGRGSVAGTADTAPSVVRPYPEPLPAGPVSLLDWFDCFGRRTPSSSGIHIPSLWAR
jgi:hypothetical protein